MKGLRRDPILRRVIDRVGHCTLSLERNKIRALSESIIYQQLAGAAAATISRRFEALWGRWPTPSQVIEARVARLRSAGLSRQKLSYLKDLSAKVLDGTVPLSRVGRMGDAEVIEVVTQVKGIGRWTAEMFLMFCLGRPDVFPTGDLGIQTAMKRLYRVRTAAGMERVAERWRPERTKAAWYLWRSGDA
jgi:DNA-3-methyladenine glycosylase II